MGKVYFRKGMVAQFALVVRVKWLVELFSVSLSRKYLARTIIYPHQQSRSLWYSVDFGNQLQLRLMRELSNNQYRSSFRKMFRFVFTSLLHPLNLYTWSKTCFTVVDVINLRLLWDMFGSKLIRLLFKTIN